MIVTRIQWGLLAVALVVMTAHLLVYIAYGVALIQFPFDYDQGEGFELVDTIMLSEGKWPYRDNETFPFYASNYPPIYHVVLIPFAWVFGAEYWYGRLIAFIGTFISAAGIGYAVNRATQHRTVGILSGLAFLASNYIYHIGPLFRQHLFMVMFEILAVVVLANVFELPQSKQRRRLIIGMILLLLAGYTKQLAYATVIAAFVWLFVRNPRRAVIYGLGLAGAAGIIFLWLNISTDGHWWTNIIAANVNQYLPRQYRGLLFQFLGLHWSILIPAGLMVFYELYFSRLSLYSVWFVFTGANTVLAGKWGAGDSYFASFIAATCILAGIFAGRTLNGDWTFEKNYITYLFERIPLPKRAATQSISLFGLILFIVYGFTVVKIPTEGRLWGSLSDRLGLEPQLGYRYPFYDSAGWTEGYATIGHLPTEQDRNSGWKIVERIEASEKPVLSEEAGFSLQAGRTVITNPTQLKNLYENDLFDPTNLVEMLLNQEFGLLIFRAQFYPPPVMAAVVDAYEPVEVIEMNGFGYELWEPSPTWQQRQQMKEFIETAAPDAEPLTLEIPDDRIDHMGNWLQQKMGYWAWLPMLIPPPAINDCPTYGFIRDDRQVTIAVCDNVLTVQPPEPFEG
ncbi:MAG: hypothetical protein L0154_20355 [Chloroflexi bacterium]|nr:hypothetical protein [Chloroflexota bacterium]